jgi:hypothetical protein
MQTSRPTSRAKNMQLQWKKSKLSESPAFSVALFHNLPQMHPNPLSWRMLPFNLKLISRMSNRTQTFSQGPSIPQAALVIHPHKCKGTSVHFLTSPILSYSPPVHMYSTSSPLYYLQGLHSKTDNLRTHSPITLQKSTPRCRSLSASPPALTSTASDEPRTHRDRSAWHYGTLCHHVDTHLWEAWW